MIFKVRQGAGGQGYWFQIIATSGKMLASSDVYETRAGLDAVMRTIMSSAADARIVDLTLEERRDDAA